MKNDDVTRSTPRVMLATLGVAAVALTTAVLSTAAAAPSGAGTIPLVGIHKIQHIVFITQENHSFDNYFGTYPGADGIPMRNGVPTVCSPDPLNGTCVAPFVSHRNNSIGGPHGNLDAAADIDRGKMDGFVKQSLQALSCRQNTPACASEPALDSMSYHVSSDIPDYWNYAKFYVLSDHFFAATASWSLPAHLYQVSGWSAFCTSPTDPASCVNNPNLGNSFTADEPKNHNYAWTDITYLMHKAGVSWNYFVVPGYQPDCLDDSSISCAPVLQNSKTPGIWNPLPDFRTVQSDNQVSNIVPVSNFYKRAAAGTLANVSWVVPSRGVSEHPGDRITDGMAYVASLINAVMRGPDWNSTAIFLSWDDWGGFYDHVIPTHADKNGYGIRVPALLISPYAKEGYIDHQVLSSDAYLKFIEDDFLGGQRLDPATDGRPDPRTSVRERAAVLGNIATEFDFNQSPRHPLLQPTRPYTTLR